LPTRSQVLETAFLELNCVMATSKSLSTEVIDVCEGVLGT
jgi:hypothetical protein